MARKTVVAVLLLLSLMSRISGQLEIDPDGYVFFCLCMGRLGNQLEHLLGGMGFASAVNRTLVLPPFRTYRNVPFSEWFRPQPVAQRLRSVTSEHFMEHIAPKIWPAEKRLGFCYQLGGDPCVVKRGNPHENFWDELGVDFADHVRFTLPPNQGKARAWLEAYPPDSYPVIALRGAPASFPVAEANAAFQSSLHFSDNVRQKGLRLLVEAFGDEGRDFVGVHLRRGSDWERACGHAPPPNGRSGYMASYQCQGWDYANNLTADQCFSSRKSILLKIRIVLRATRFQKLLIATDDVQDSLSLLKHLRVEFPELRIAHPNPELPVVDLFLLSHSGHFVGNCVSSFSGFVWRQREAHGLGPTSHFGTPFTKHTALRRGDEL